MSLCLSTLKNTANSKKLIGFGLTKRNDSHKSISWKLNCKRLNSFKFKNERLNQTIKVLNFKY